MKLTDKRRGSDLKTMSFCSPTQAALMLVDFGSDSIFRIIYSLTMQGSVYYRFLLIPRLRTLFIGTYRFGNLHPCTLLRNHLHNGQLSCRMAMQHFRHNGTLMRSWFQTVLECTLQRKRRKLLVAIKTLYNNCVFYLNRHFFCLIMTNAATSRSQSFFLICFLYYVLY